MMCTAEPAVLRPAAHPATLGHHDECQDLLSTTLEAQAVRSRELPSAPFRLWWYSCRCPRLPTSEARRLRIDEGVQFSLADSLLPCSSKPIASVRPGWFARAWRQALEDLQPNRLRGTRAIGARAPAGRHRSRCS
eukprot:3106653-Prymnesium_polylepis.2